LYELSGTFTHLYRRLGYKVIQVDTQLDGSDVRLLKKFEMRIIGILAFPPCTHFSGSGARWWKKKGDKPLLDALSMVDAVLRMVQIYQPDFWMLENPVGRLRHFIGKPAYMFNPCQYSGYLDNPDDEAYTKKTCLWGIFNVPQPKPVYPKHGSMMHKLKNPKTGKYYSFTGEKVKNWRSKTPEGFARAFVEVNPLQNPEMGSGFSHS